MNFPYHTESISQHVHHFKGSHKKKNVPKSGKSPKGGGGVSAGDQKVHNSKCGLFDKRGGGKIFSVFPNLDVDFKCFS